MASRRAAHPGKPCSKEERIERIMDYMRKPGTFKAGEMYPRLMKEFDVCADVIKRDCAEASRNVRREINDPDAVAVDVGKAFQETLDAAMKVIREQPGTPDAIKAMGVVERMCKSWSQIVGADVPMRVEVKQVGEMTPQQANEMARKAFGKVTPKDEKE